jgi:hypothetical protein
LSRLNGLAARKFPKTEPRQQHRDADNDFYTTLAPVGLRSSIRAPSLVHGVDSCKF